MGFIFGFSLVFILMGLSATAVGGLLARHIEVLRKVGALIVILLGLHLAGLYRLAFLERTAQARTLPVLGRWQPLLLGIVFAFGWTPCVGPILASILIVASSSGDPVTGGLLLASYSAGFSLPFVLAAVFTERVTRGLKSLGPYLPAISRVSGLGLVFLGILLYMNRL
jgi:cytochrome c-type biogenesis protein